MSSRQGEFQKNEEPERIDIMTILSDYFRVLRRMWKRVLLLGLVGTVLFWFKGNKEYCPHYTASATFTINISQDQQNGSSANTSFFDNSAAEQMAKTFPYILTSGVLQRRVAKDIGRGAVPGVIEANVVEETNLLTLSVNDIDAERAYRTLEAVVKNYPQISEVIVGKVNMEMLDETGIPPLPDNPKNLKRDMAKGGIAGLLLGFCWVALVMFGRKTIRREEDCTRLVNTRCLGSVPQVHFKERSRKVEHHLNILEENTDPDFVESFRIIRNKLQRSAREHSLKSILVTSALAGEGKSTIAVNLALSLALEGKKVALIDCDLRHPSDRGILNVEEGKGLAEYLKKEISLKECILEGGKLGLDNSVNFVFVSGGSAIADGSDLLGSRRMKKITAFLEEQMDYVILDSAPSGLLTDAGVLAQYADGAVFVVRKDFAHADYILEGMEHLAEGNVHMMGCILNGDD